MSTPSTDGLKIEIDQGRMRIGNQVQLASGLPAVTAVSNLTADANSNLQTHARITGFQPDVTAGSFNITGKSTSGILTATLVSGADVTTATKAAFIRLDLTDSNGNITNGSYYLEAFTIT